MLAIALLTAASLAAPSVCHARARLLDDVGEPLSLFLSFSANPTAEGGLSLGEASPPAGALIAADRTWVTVNAVVQGEVAARADSWTVSRDGDAFRIAMIVDANRLVLRVVPGARDLAIDGVWDRDGVVTAITGTGKTACSAT